MNGQSNIISKAKRWKKTKCLLIDEWINKIWFIHTMEHYLAIKNKVPIYART